MVGAFQQGDSRSEEVEVRPVADGPVTTVLLRRLSGEDSWSVLGATTDSIRVTSPEALAVITSPVTVRGAAWTVEWDATVFQFSTVRTAEYRIWAAASRERARGGTAARTA
ncbi:MAG: hypothetical protein EPN99_01195 [Frankiales bacterium]|nr:MAG: hypothetical protein EPN99_01195 [Frankiales bacterium]